MEQIHFMKSELVINDNRIVVNSLCPKCGRREQHVFDGKDEQRKVLSQGNLTQDEFSAVSHRQCWSPPEGIPWFNVSFEPIEIQCHTKEEKKFKVVKVGADAKTKKS